MLLPFHFVRNALFRLGSLSNSLGRLIVSNMSQLILSIILASLQANSTFVNTRSPGRRAEESNRARCSIIKDFLHFLKWLLGSFGENF